MITGFNTNPRAAGHYFAMGPWGELSEGQTLQCCHCQYTWTLVKGSGRERGWCGRCMGYTCGNPVCGECVPAERRAENVEAGRPVLTPCPAMILVPAGVEGLEPAGG